MDSSTIVGNAQLEGEKDKNLEKIEERTRKDHDWISATRQYDSFIIEFSTA